MLGGEYARTRTHVPARFLFRALHASLRTKAYSILPPRPGATKSDPGRTQRGVDSNGISPTSWTANPFSMASRRHAPPRCGLAGPHLPRACVRTATHAQPFFLSLPLCAMFASTNTRRRTLCHRGVSCSRQHRTQQPPSRCTAVQSRCAAGGRGEEGEEQLMRSVSCPETTKCRWWPGCRCRRASSIHGSSPTAG